MTDRQPLHFARLTDHSWLRQSFMISHGVVTARSGAPTSSSGNPSDTDMHMRARFFTPAEFKFSDTTLGGNMVINPAPQFTRNADPRVKGIYQESVGLGRYYSDALDDNKRIITMTFGVAQFNSLSTFYKGFYESSAATVARTGRAPSIFFRAGQAAGFVVGLMSPWLVLYSLGSAFINIALMQPSSKYYFFKPSMASYWNAVSGIANDIAVKTQLVSRKFSLPDSSNPSMSANDNRSAYLSKEDLRQINHSVFSVLDSYDESTGEANGVNVYAVATRYQRMQRAAFSALEEAYKNRSSVNEFQGSVNEEGQAMLKIVQEKLSTKNQQRPKRSFRQYLDDWTSGDAPGALLSSSPASQQMNLSTTDAPADGTAAAPVAVPEDAKDLLTEASISDAAGSTKTKWYEFLAAELDDGAQYVAFRVENTGDASESFSNQVGESEIAGKINGISGSARSTRFSAADGNIDGGIVGKLVGGIMTGVKDVAMGAASSLGIDGIAALGGNAFVDIPKHWMQSTSQLPSMNYRVKLVSPYGNRYSKFVNIWLPLSMLLAGALPLSTGKHSYTSPFLCQLFDRGRAQTRLGMIDQMTITRGGMNLPFNRIGEPMSIEVSFSVVELSNIVHMPIHKAFNPIADASFSSIFDNDSLYQDYIAVLSSLSLTEQIYVGERIKIGLTKYLKNFDSWASVPHAVNWMGDMAPVRVFSMFFDGMANR